MNRKSSRQPMPRISAAPGDVTINRASARLMAVAGFAAGALAIGAVAVGAAAIGAVAIGSLAVGRARLRRVEIAELRVARLSVGELIVDRGPEAAARPVERRTDQRDG